MGGVTDNVCGIGVVNVEIFPGVVVGCFNRIIVFLPVIYELLVKVGILLVDVVDMMVWGNSW
ncbi:MAG: hypothetical protein MGG11_18355 [Trichodesmium sp. MAG_R03]|nr:hypothetical protein [Trichodesmium sp. MAG_R03]